MGFGVSGSTAIIFLGVLICTGTLYTAAAGTAETITDAQDSTDERLLDRRNTDVNVTSVTYSDNNGTYPMDIRVENTGTTTLTVNDTSLLVNNEYRHLPDAVSVSVNGTSGTEVWAPGEELLVELSESEEPQRVKIVTENGVTAVDETLVEV